MQLTPLSLALVCVCFTTEAIGQAIPKRDTARTRQEADLENLLEQVTQDAEDSQLLDLLTRLEENPLDVNEASAEDLHQVPGITPIIAFNIIALRARHAIRDLDNLLQVDGVTVELLQRIRPFLRVGVSERKGETQAVTSYSFRTRAAQDLQSRRGFQDGSFRGSATKLYNRFTARVTQLDAAPGREDFGRRRHSFPSLELGIVTEKDAGEAKVADFAAGYLAANIPSVSTRVILGDFVVESAEGLVFWRSIGLSKGTEVIANVRKNGGGLRPYLSTDENWYFRGIAADVSLDWLNLAVMYSNKPLHAALDTMGVVTSFDNSGLFRNERESDRRNQSRERLLGVRTSATPLEGLKVGFSAYETRFANQVLLSSGSGFQGQTGSIVGVDFSYTQPRFNLFSEVARDHHNSVAGVAGILLRPHSTIDVTCLVRSYPKDFVSLHSTSFGESGGSARNESGAYLGISLRPLAWLRVSTYHDQFVFPWRTFSTDFPSSGHDFFAFSEITIAPRLLLQLQYKDKSKGDRRFTVDAVGRLAEVEGLRAQKNYRATIELNSARAFRWRSRIEAVTVNYPDSTAKQKGILVFQDVRVLPLDRLRIDARVIAFHTDSYDSRLYEYESELSGTLSNPALFGKGLRWYILACYEMTATIDVWLKYSQTMREGVKSIGTGENEILGDHESRISFQIDLRL